MVFPRPLSKGACALRTSIAAEARFPSSKASRLVSPQPLQGTCALSRNFNRAASVLSVIQTALTCFPQAPFKGLAPWDATSIALRARVPSCTNSRIQPRLSRNSIAKIIEILQFSGNSAANHQNYSWGCGLDWARVGGLFEGAGRGVREGGDPVLAMHNRQ